MGINGEESSLAIRARQAVLTFVSDSIYREVPSADVEIMCINRTGDTRVHRVHDLLTGDSVYVETTVRIVTRAEFGS